MDARLKQKIPNKICQESCLLAIFLEYFIDFLRYHFFMTSGFQTQINQNGIFSIIETLSSLDILSLKSGKSDD